MSTRTMTSLRRFVKTDLDANSNKIWEIVTWSDGTYTTKWGRVGSELRQSDHKPYRDTYVINGLCSRQRSEGYGEILLQQNVDTAKALATLQVNDPCDKFAAVVLAEANESIKEFLDTSLDSISIINIIDARNQLTRIAAAQATKDFASQKNLITVYYRMIPTVLPHKIDAQSVVQQFDVEVQETRLQQLEAGIAGLKLNGSLADQLGGVKLRWIPAGDPTYVSVMAHVATTGGGNLKVKGLYEAQIPGERRAWIDNKRGKDNTELLYHGTKSANIRHILRSGLILPRNLSYAPRMGPGIYFSDKFQRSINYTGGKHSTMMLIAHVALGKIYKTEGNYHVSQPPAGYDSTCGLGTRSGLGDEYVVYSPDQQTIRFVLWLERP